MQSATFNIDIEKKVSFSDKVLKRILHLFHLSIEPVVKIYHGYGNAAHMIVFGHVFSLSPVARKKYRENWWTNTFALLRSFMVVRIPNAPVRLQWEGRTYETTTASDGFFRFEMPSTGSVVPGTYRIEVEYYEKDGLKETVLSRGTGSIIVPHKNQYAFLSDIDDTFLVSHSSNIRKRLYVLLTKNAHSRKPFEDVVHHYQLLASAHTTRNNPNPFFYVSSSEWNLYDFIKEFSRKNQLPEGVFLLSQIKKLTEVWKTGATKHSTKFMRIARILEAYPDQKFILLGDDSQMDPSIYSSIVTHFPGRIVSVYLRHVYDKNLVDVKEMIKKVEAAGVYCCHFEHSKAAIKHSYEIGLIDECDELDLAIAN